MIVTTYNQHVRLLSSEPFGCLRFQSLLGPGSRHCLWNHYVFWSGKGEEESITKNWAKYYIAPCFRAAKISNDGHMMSHRLRDTFAVDLLEKGVPLEEVSKLLGHESIKTTEKHYAKWVKGRQDRLDSLVVATWKK